MRRVQKSIVYTLKACGRAALTASLCALLVEQPLLAEVAVKKTVPAPVQQIQGQERVLHALNRMTFGPRPGDVAAVQAMGLNKWFERQLNPGSIDDSALDARLAQYPATMMTIAELEKKYPSPNVLRAMGDGKVPLPTDPTLHALVRDQLAIYELAQEYKGKIAPGQAALAMNGQAESKKDRKNAPLPAPVADDETAPTAADASVSKKDRRRAAMAAGSDGGTGSMGADGMAGGQQVGSTGELEGTAMQAAAARPGFRRLPEADVQALMAKTPDERYKAILALEPMDLIRLRGSLDGKNAGYLTAGMTPDQRETVAALGGGLRVIASEAMASRLERDIYSDRQLEAVMTDFWLNHFNVYAGKNQYEPYMLSSYERETIRPHALGKFEDLLVATAKAPAMLTYLDNAKSVGPDAPIASRIKRYKQIAPNNPAVQAAAVGLNENYGREVMELHTLGVNGAGYTQADVTNNAKVFTGWTMDKPYEGNSYVFDAKRHEPGAKIILGKTIPEGGEQEGLTVLHMLATNPSTARFISTKLAVRFVSDDPPASLVDKMTDEFLKSDGDIKTVLRTMFNAPEFWSPDVYRAKVKTPLEFVVSAARASGLEVQQPAALVQSLVKLGMPLYGMQTPNGYSWKKDQWVSTGALVSRMNFSLVLSDDRMPGTRTEWPTLLGESVPKVVPAAYAQGDSAQGESELAKERRLEMLLLGAPVSDRTRATVLEQSTDLNITAQAATQFDLGAAGKGAKKLGEGPRGNARPQAGKSEDPQAAVMAGLLMGSPEFQRR